MWRAQARWLDASSSGKGREGVVHVGSPHSREPLTLIPRGPSETRAPPNTPFAQCGPLISAFEYVRRPRSQLLAPNPRVDTIARGMACRNFRSRLASCAGVIA